MWKKFRSGVMFVIACVTSPCCTPLIVPLGIALLAGTPLALWLSAHLGWVYGGLTIVSVISLVLGLRWMGQRKGSKQSVKIEHQDIALPVQNNQS
jgi:predicted MFS family arabinose efflux permease